MATISYSTNPASGPLAGGIGWIGYGVLTLAPGGSSLGNTVTLRDGSIFRFDVRNVAVSGGGATVVATPQNPGYPFGVGYSGVTGNVVLYTNSNSASTRIIMENITVTDPLGNPVTNYTIYIADGEVTGTNESIVSTTNGGPWQLLGYVGGGASPTVTGLGTLTVSYTGSGATYRSPICSTLNPTTVSSVLTESGISGRSGIVYGVSISKITLNKNITNRYEVADQFKLDIIGNNAATTTTFGTTFGSQSVSAYVYASIPGTYTLTEAMAIGSVSSINQYNRTISYTNLTPGGTTVPTSITLPSTLNINNADVIVATITNSIIQPTIATSKSVDKNYDEVSGILTYTIPITNNGSVTITNVVFIDTIPQGSNFIPNSFSINGTTVTGSPAPPTGITIPDIIASKTTTISFKVQITPTIPSPNVIINNSTTKFSFYALPNTLTSGNVSNQVMTTINYATISMAKQSNFSYVNLGTTITYTVQINNKGSVSATNVLFIDTIPNDTTYINGSLKINGNTIPGNPNPPGINIGTIPIGLTTISFAILVDKIPSPNPIPNSASINYNYTINPSIPNGGSGKIDSNITLTQVNNANLKSITKSVNKVYAICGDILTYTITIPNSGNVTAVNVIFKDTIPLGTSLIPNSVTVDAITIPGANPQTGINIGTIPAGSTSVVTFKVQISC